MQRSLYLPGNDHRHNEIGLSLMFDDDMAIVGNGGCLLDEPRGAEIDAHAVVARFNNYELEPVENTGSRTDIWVTSLYLDVRSRDERYDRVLCPIPFPERAWTQHPYRRNDKLAEAFDVEYIPGELFLELERRIPRPSTGIAFLWWICRVRGPVDRSSIYGFDNFAGRLHYFDGMDRCAHDRDAERALFEELTK